MLASLLIPGGGLREYCQHINLSPVYKFDLISAIPSALTSITVHHLPLFQCIAITFQMFIFSISFVVPLYTAILLSC